MLIVLLGDDYELDLRRAPDVRRGLHGGVRPVSGPMAVAFTELQGVLSAHQWREKGVDVPALGARVHPHYGVFSPIRGEYIDLVAAAHHCPTQTRRSPAPRLSTSARAPACSPRSWPAAASTASSPRTSTRARSPAPATTPNGWASPTASRRPDTGLYPDGRADLVVCNPPWLPGRPVSAVEGGVYDPDAAMLNGFLAGLADHLRPGGEGWLVLSDLAEHLGLRGRDRPAGRHRRTPGLLVADGIETRPTHPGTERNPDLLADARRREVTSLWRLRPETD